MAVLDTDILVQLIRAKYAYLTQLRDMGRRQLELVDAANMTGLLDVLSAKQRPLAELQRIERALDPYRAQDPEGRRWQSAQQRAGCAEQLHSCDALLVEIIDQEKRSEETLVRRRDETAVKLQSMHVAGQARGAYAAAGHADFSQLDLLSDK